MGQLSANVVDGVLQQSNTAISTTSKKTLGSSELGKDAFLQLLVCQMQNQDPLNPSTDTEFVSQLATFSQLEQLQNLTTASEQSQAFSLVGKEVILSVEDDNGKTKTISGTVDFITVSGKKVKLSVDGSLYDMDKLLSVVDSTYSTEINSPKVVEKVKYVYDADNPKDLTFEINLGDNKMKADDIALVLGEQVLNSSMISISDNKVTVKKEVFEQLPNGVYSPSVVFNNDPYYTTIEGMIEITVKNSKVTEDETDESTDEVTDESTDKVTDETGEQDKN